MIQQFTVVVLVSTIPAPRIGVPHLTEAVGGATGRLPAVEAPALGLHGSGVSVGTSVIAEQTSPANLRSHQRKRATYSVSPIRGRRALEGQQAADGTGRVAASAARGGKRRREARVWVLVARVFLRLS